MSDHAFTLDRFQREALGAIDRDLNVLVAAPTGSGKTVVGDHCVDRALACGARAFYTTPIKALSNQKFNDLVKRLGEEQVGLLTGDNVIRPDAPVIVMTTEVLRNMVYARSATLDRLQWVVLDEVHFLQDRYRGPVWEEVLVHTPGHVRFVCLSATVSNAGELAGWIRQTRGPTELIVEHERPVDLVNHFLVRDRASNALVEVETLINKRPNPEGSQFDPKLAKGPSSNQHKSRYRQRWSTPRRSDVVAHLKSARLLPALYFVFSRKGCDEAVKNILDSGMRLTTGSERQRIREIVEARIAHLSAEDRSVLEVTNWKRALEAGVGAHHAGLVAPFKEAVEACFVEGLVKVVFATETLALGINMPARSVVIEALSKFTGETHEDLTPAQYTQLTGRAGRRGLDPVGHAYVLWSPWHNFDQVAALAASREFVLRSAFAPTPNMVANLVRRCDRDEALELMGRSFAQYQADATLGALLQKRAGRSELLEQARKLVTCELGDVDEYRALRAEQRELSRQKRSADQALIEESLGELRPGDVVLISSRRFGVLSVAFRKGTLKARILDEHGDTSTITAQDLDMPVRSVATLNVPRGFDPRSRRAQQTIAEALRRVEPGVEKQDPSTKKHLGKTHDAECTDQLGVSRCPDLKVHLEAAHRRDKLEGQIRELDRRIARRRDSLGLQFEAVETVLRTRGFIEGWQLTNRGEVLARIFHECDLLVASAICDGLLDGLGPPDLAAVVSAFVYEHRSKGPPPALWYPNAAVRNSCSRIGVLATDLNFEEATLRLNPTRVPDPSFILAAYAWASGESLAAVLENEEMSGGDFVRTVKVLIDLLRQIGSVAPEADTQASARSAAEALMRGVVSASSELNRENSSDD